MKIVEAKKKAPILATTFIPVSFQWGSMYGIMIAGLKIRRNDNKGELSSALFGVCGNQFRLHCHIGFYTLQFYYRKVSPNQKLFTFTGTLVTLLTKKPDNEKKGLYKIPT